MKTYAFLALLTLFANVPPPVPPTPWPTIPPPAPPPPEVPVRDYFPVHRKWVYHYVETPNLARWKRVFEARETVNDTPCQRWVRLPDAGTDPNPREVTLISDDWQGLRLHALRRDGLNLVLSPALTLAEADLAAGPDEHAATYELASGIFAWRASVVSRTEDVQTGLGLLKHCLHLRIAVTQRTSVQTTEDSWFAPGIGLVKRVGAPMAPGGEELLIALDRD